MSNARAEARRRADEALDAKLAAIGGPRWFDPDGNVIGVRQADFLLAIPHWLAVTILQTSTGPIKVSTVFLSMDHAMTAIGFPGEPGPPVVWETMIFGGPHSLQRWRGSDRTQAAAQHVHAVDWLRSSLPEHDITVHGSWDWPMAPVLRPAGRYLSLRERLLAAYGRRRLGRLRARYKRHRERQARQLRRARQGKGSAHPSHRVKRRTDWRVG